MYQLFKPVSITVLYTEEMDFNIYVLLEMISFIIISKSREQEWKSVFNSCYLQTSRERYFETHNSIVVMYTPYSHTLSLHVKKINNENNSKKVFRL